MWHQETLRVPTRGRGSQDLTRQVAAVVARAGVRVGMCHVFVEHTSASLMLCENADPTVRQDLETILARLAPDGDPAYRHTLEGPDDMSAHGRTVLTHSTLSVPVKDGRCGLGTWQGIFLWEHRTVPHTRQVSVTVHGE